MEYGSMQKLWAPLFPSEQKKCTCQRARRMKQDFISLERDGFTVGYVQTAGGGRSGPVFIADIKDLVEYSAAGAYLKKDEASGSVCPISLIVPDSRRNDFAGRRAFTSS